MIVLYLATLYYIKKDGDYKEIVINSHRHHKNYDLITFNNIKNINDVLEYVGSEIYVTHDYKDLQDNEYYYEDLISKKVYDTDNNYLGVVKDIREVPQGIILEVKNEKTFLVPFVSEFIKDIEDDKIIINVIEGLI